MQSSSGSCLWEQCHRDCLNACMRIFCCRWLYSTVIVRVFLSFFPTNKRVCVCVCVFITPTFHITAVYRCVLSVMLVTSCCDCSTQLQSVVKVVMCSRGGGWASEVETHKHIDSVLHTKTTFQAHSTSISSRSITKLMFSVSIQK